MEKLIAGLRRFQSKEFPRQAERFRELAISQRPCALVITCSDSRIDPSLLLGTDPGDIFVLRNAGNFVPEYGNGDSSESATVEYAVSVLGVPDLIVMGHSQCGAMLAALDPASAAGMPAVSRWLHHADAALATVGQRFTAVADIEPAVKLAAAVEANVVAQMERVRQHPSVARAVANGELRVHGWVYDIASGTVSAYSPATGAFAPLA